MKKEVTEKLKKYGQLHLLKYIDELSEKQVEDFEKQLEESDFSVLDINEDNNKRGNIEPMGALTVEKINDNRKKFIKTGIEAIREGKVGAVLLAGGQGSRLGYDGPKGTFNIGVNKNLFIFECLINNLLKVVKQTDTWIPLFIMTSKQNDTETKHFLKMHEYFGYNSKFISFFKQEQLPTVDTDGKLMLRDKGVLSTAPNGNGGWYYSMYNAGLLDKLNKDGIEWLNVFAVDNVLQKIADPCFIGAVIDSGCESGAKVVAKASPDERVGVLCLEDGKPSIVEYYEMTDEMRICREPDGRLSYNYGVILNYLFNVKSLDKGLGAAMPLHRAFKKLTYLDDNGKIIKPDKPNAYKFETLVLDMVKMQDSCLAFEVERDKEFAPVKNKEGVDSIDTARKLLLKNGIEI